MRPDRNEADTRAHQSGRGRAAAAARKSQLRRIALEPLEAKALMAVAADPTPAVVPAMVSGVVGNESSPTIAVSPTNPSKMVAVWTNINTPNLPAPIRVLSQAAFSNDGGATWNTFFQANQLADPTTSADNRQPFSRAENIQVAIDRNNRVYFLHTQRNEGNTAGAMVLSSFSFSGNTPGTVTSRTLEQWTTNIIHDPHLVVDDTLASFTDPTTNQTITNPSSGNVYISYVTTDTPRAFNPPNPFNPNRVVLITSSDGGASFSSPQTINDNGNGGSQLNAAPRVAVSQGTTDGRVTPGLVNIVWDDFGSGATATPPRDLIKAEQVTPGVAFRATGSGTINDSPGNDVVVTTNIPIEVTAGNVPAGFTSLADLDLRLIFTHPGLDQVSVTLIPPQASGRASITIFNADDLEGTNLGVLNGIGVGTTFDDSASRNIFDNDGAGNNANDSPYADSFRPITGSFANNFAGMTPTAGPDGFLGTWTLRVTDNSQNTGTIQQVNSATIIFTSGLEVDPDGEGNTTIAQSFVRGGLDGIGQNALAASPVPIAPAPAIASDNTLGSFSPFQGRIYAAFTNYIHPTQFGGSNPADNTDIHLSFSDDGGVTWTNAHTFSNPVNDDAGSTDGFSEAIIDFQTQTFDGRPQFNPAIAVDQATGSLVMSWLDARHDAARARVATYLATSVDGGVTFGSQVFANPDQGNVSPTTGAVNSGVVDAITGRPVALGPLPDNQSAGNPVRDAVYGYGRRIGLVASNGIAFPTWAGNQNFAGPNNDGVNASQLLDIYVNRVAIGAGPRVVQGTSGPITGLTATALADGSAIAINSSTDTDGTPLLDGLVVTFDRPIYRDANAVSDPQNFGLDDIKVFFRDTTLGNATSVPVSIGDIIPLVDPAFADSSILGTIVDEILALDPDLSDAEALALARVEQQRRLGATRYYIKFADPRGGVGTYSYQVGPQYRDRIRTVDASGNIRAGNLADQNADGTTNQALVNGAAPDGVDVFMMPRPVGEAITLAASGAVLAPFSADSLPVILNGPRVASVTAPGEPVGDTLAVDRVVQGLDITFDRDIQVSSFSPQDVLTVDGPTGVVTGPFTVRPAWRSTVAAPIPDNPATPLVSTILIQGSGPFSIADLDVSVEIRHSHAADLTLTLIGPDGTRVPLAALLGGPIGADYRDTTFDDGGALEGDPLGRSKSLLSITQAPAPFTGRYRPVGNLSAFNGLDITGEWKLEIVDSTAGNSAGSQLVAWSLTATSSNPSPDVVARTFRVEFFSAAGATSQSAITPNIQKVSGTYAITLSSDIVSGRGDRLDEDRDAGLDLLRGVDPAGKTTLVQATAAPNLPLGDAVGSTPTTTSSSIVVTDDFLIQGLTLQLNINHNRVRDLTAVLVTPAGDRVTLFSPDTLRVNGANFSSTTFDDSAATYIRDGGPPYFGSFRPEQPLSDAYIDQAGNSRRSAGTYTLEITDSTGGVAGTLVNWTLNFRKPQTGDGLGEEVSDRPRASFRIFTMDATNPLSSTNWTAVGPASVTAELPFASQQRWAGRIGAIAVDPSDPSGNTVYVAGASGGVWKSVNFLTTAAGGPTYIPLTDFGPNFSTNIGSIAVFGRNGDPNQSIIYVATGEGDDSAGFGTSQTGRGIGFLRSMDGGRTWEVLDSTDNTSAPNSSSRNRSFVGMTAFKVVVDPTPSTTGEVLLYAALSGTAANGTATGGLWRSDDSGDTWRKLSVDAIHGTQATDIVLDPFSSDATSKNLDRFHVAFRDTGVFRATSRGDNLTRLVGGVGKPLVQDADAPPTAIAVGNAGDTPPTGGRIVVAQPTPSSVAAWDISYQDWLYSAAVEGGSIVALYVTKDRGENWTRVEIPATAFAIPSNDRTEVSLNLGQGEGLGGNFAITLAVDPTNPAVVYLGGNLGDGHTLIRLDTTLIHDAHNLTVYNPSAPDGGLMNATGGTNGASSASILKDVNRGLPVISDTFSQSRTAPDGRFPNRQAINVARNPLTPLAANATFFLNNVSQFVNDGSNVLWTPFTDPLLGANGVHDLVTFVDPLTGQARLIVGTDQGVYTAVDDNGQVGTGIGSAASASGSRNGNLQIGQIHYGAVQPVGGLADLFRAMSWQIDFPASDADILGTGNLDWTDTDGLSSQGSGSGVATAQVDDTSRGAVYEYKWPGDGGRFTDFFQVNGVGRTVGLLRGQNDPQWFGLSPVIAPGIRFGNFTVNPINNDQVIISSGEGRLYNTEDQGRTWREIGVPTVFGGAGLNSYAPALAFGAPEPGATVPGSLNDFLYVGTVSGRIFMTRTGGGAAGTEWTEISNGLDGSSVLNIITSPNRGTREAYAVTRSGVYYTPDSTSGVAWQNITNGLFSVRHNPFGNDLLAEDSLVDNELHTITADWRYLIPEDPYSTTNTRVHPILYAAGNGGVFRSLDNGQTWTSFPDNITDASDPAEGTAADYGYLPNVRVTDLDLSLGFVNPANGRPVATNSPNLLVASTFGRGQFAIRLAPLILEETVRLHPNLPAPGGSDSGIVGINGSTTDRVTNVVRPVLQGIGEQTAFGNAVRITIYDLTDPINPRIIGGYDPADPDTANDLANYTNDAGLFAVQVYEDAFLDSNGQVVQGLKKLGIQATNASGTKGNMVDFEFTLDTIAPAAPATPDLALASDTGPVNFPNPNDDSFPNFPGNRTDNYTSDNSPEFEVAGIEADNVVYLFRDNTLVRTVTGAPAGTLTIGDPGPVAPGRYLYTVRQVDRAGNQSPISASLEVVIDTTPPNVPSRPALVAADDTGTVGDNITANTRPRVTGSLALVTSQPDAEAIPANLPLVRLIDPSGNVLGQSRVGNDGSYTVVFDQPLSPGSYIVRVQAVDRVGNLGNASQSLTLTIDTSAPPAITLQLDPRDDTGLASDNITSIRQPRLLGNTGPNLSVQIIDVDGTVTGTPGAPVGAAVPSQPNGLFTLQLPAALPDGLYRLVARATNNVGNTSTSAVLNLRIDATPPGGVPDLRLEPASDTGIKGDGRTSNRRPFLIGTTDPNSAVEIVGPNGSVLSTGTADASGAFRLQLASNLVNGTIELRVRSRDVAGNLGGLSAPFRLTVETTTGDYDADGKADLALFRADATTDTARFTILRSALGLQAQDFGRPGDIPLHADFDGDGITDLAVFRAESDLLPGSSEWFILGSRTGARRVQFGGSGLDLPAPADFDGDGIADLAVFRPNSDLLPGSSEWFILGSSTGPRRVQFGKAGDDIPVPADFDADGKADLAVFRPASDLVPGSAHWFVALSAGGAINQPFGEANADLPAAADFNGDGRVDIGLFRPSTAQWFVLPTGTGGTGAYLQAFGAPGDYPAPADYDGDGTADLAIFRPSTAQWTVRNSSTGNNAVTPLGTATDIPILAPLAYLDNRPGTIVSPRSASAGTAAFASFSAASMPAPAEQAAQRAVALDFGQQANRLSTGASSGGSTGASTTTDQAPASVARTRPAQAAAARKTQREAAAQESATPATRTGILGWLQRRRAGRRTLG